MRYGWVTDWLAACGPELVHTVATMENKGLPINAKILAHMRTVLIPEKRVELMKYMASKDADEHSIGRRAALL